MSAFIQIFNNNLMQIFVQFVFMQRIIHKNLIDFQMYRKIYSELLKFCVLYLEHLIIYKSI